MLFAVPSVSAAHQGVAAKLAALLAFVVWWVAMMSSREFVFGSSVRIILTPL